MNKLRVEELTKLTKKMTKKIKDDVTNISSAESYLDEKFPKVKAKFRGEAMVLLALAKIEGGEEGRKIILKEIKIMKDKSDRCTDCGGCCCDLCMLELKIRKQKCKKDND